MTAGLLSALPAGGDLLTWGALLAGVVYGALKALERFGVLRSPTAWRTEAEALDREVKRLAARIEAMAAELNRLRGENSELKQRPDYSALYELMERHDRREAENHKASLALMQKIADGLDHFRR